MKILDVFSWLPAKEISLEQLQVIFEEYYTGTYKGEYTFSLETPDNFSSDMLNCKSKLMKAQKKVCYIIKQGKTIAMIGYIE